MTNVIQGPWLDGAICKPRRRMTKAERAAFDAWLDWLVDTWVRAMMLGRPAFERWCRETASMHGICTEVDASNAQDVLGLKLRPLDLMLDMGMGLSAVRGEGLREKEPPLPKVWPSEFHIANIREKLEQASLLRHGLGLAS